MLFAASHIHANKRCLFIVFGPLLSFSLHFARYCSKCCDWWFDGRYDWWISKAFGIHWVKEYEGERWIWLNNTYAHNNDANVDICFQIGLKQLIHIIKYMLWTNRRNNKNIKKNKKAPNTFCVRVVRRQIGNVCPKYLFTIH